MRFGGRRLRRASLLLVALCGLLLVVIAEGTGISQQSPEHLYAVATGLKHDDMPARANAAEKLAEHPEGAPWISLLLVASQRAATGDADERARQELLHTFELGIVTVVLRHLPENVDASVLWAMTYLLDDEECGEWSTKTGTIVKKLSEHSGPPVRELARECLKDRLGVDHKWGAAAWREAIINREAGAP
jgi:hypothetical protein